MTDAEARDFLSEGMNLIEWDQSFDKPAWRRAMIVIDGQFTANQLEAILHFKPELSMARSDPQVNIRMPQELKDRLESDCRETGRSLNAEIIHRLQECNHDLMFSMHREFMRRYEDLVQDRDNWKVIAEKGANNDSAN